MVQSVSVVRAEPSEPSTPSEPSAPSAPSEPSSPSSPSAPSTQEEQSNNNDENDHDNDEEESSSTQEEQAAPETQSETPQDPQTTETASTNEGETQSGQVGQDATIGTGDATSTGTISNLGNLNTSTGGGAGGTGGSSVVNSGSGEGSTNTGSVTIENSDDTTQTNGAVVKNTLDQSAVSGDNEASKNTGANSTITTGDSNVSGTILNAVNTNVDGVAVAEFNIVDDHIGDIILDFGDTSCIVGCLAGDTTVKNEGNGSDSTNTGDITTINDENTFQQNDADIENNMTLLADSGSNDASKNTGGDSTITTGDASIAANVLNFVNNNLAGNVILGIVNIFGDLTGDIILPDNPFASCASCIASNITAGNTGNGSGSSNDADVTVLDNDNTFQYNDATIENNIIVDATTGENSASSNTGGNNWITTGDADANVQTFNIANSNTLGGDWWLVLVNNAGQWIGQILGAPAGQNFAGGTGTEFIVDPLTGEITAMNTGNGAGSTNDADITNINNSTTTQINNANIVNNLDLTANTGGNSTNSNTGGNNSILTGDAHVVANIINFVNNNFAGNGRLFVTVVNVFGSWMGDLVAPGQEKQSNNQNLAANTNPPAGGSNNSNHGVGGNPSNNSSNQSSTNGSNSSGNVQVSGQISGGGNVSFSGGNNSQTGGQIIIAKAKDIKGLVDDAQKTIQINLAWLFLTVPVAIFLVLRRKFGFINSVIAKGIHLFL